MTKKNKKAGKKHPLDDRFYVRAFGKVYTQWELADIVIRETLAPMAHETVDLDIVSGLWLRFVEDYVGLLEAIHERWLANSKTPIRQRDLYPFDLEFSQFLKPGNGVARHVIMAMEATTQPMAFGDEAFMQALSNPGGLKFSADCSITQSDKDVYFGINILIVQISRCQFAELCCNFPAQLERQLCDFLLEFGNMLSNSVYCGIILSCRHRTTPLA